MTTRFIDKVYGLDSAEKTGAFYDAWADSYDAEVEGEGYASPGRAAATLAAHLPDRAAPILDLGCGTGISGRAFAAAGFTAIDGTDLSAEMLARAGATGVYRRLSQGDLARPLAFGPGDYAAVAAIGVVNPGHAPPETVSEVLRRLAPGAFFVFTLNDHALAEAAFANAADAAIAAGLAERVEETYGEHLPGLGLKSRVTLLRRP